MVFGIKQTRKIRGVTREEKREEERRKRKGEERGEEGRKGRRHCDEEGQVGMRRETLQVSNGLEPFLLD